MLPKTHAFFGFLFSITFFLIFSEIGYFGFLIIWVASIFIDVDHYLFYIITKKDVSLRNAYRYFIKMNNLHNNLSRKEKRKLPYNVFCIFHGIETILVLVLLSLFHRIFLYILIGFIFHEFLDLVYLLYHGYRLNHVGSQTYNILNYRKSF